MLDIIHNHPGPGRLQLMYEKGGLNLQNLQWSLEGKAYGACSYELCGQRVIHRHAKITPTKNGQFVTLWKRNQQGVTMPLDASDAFDVALIAVEKGEKFGLFIFPKKLLAGQGIISEGGLSGKRGFRVYPAWDQPESRQAAITQQWQQSCFIEDVADPAAISITIRSRLGPIR